ncbi:MAG: hypothetical protein Kow0025_12250 [Thermodesulfovibrionales bacterium]
MPGESRKITEVKMNREDLKKLLAGLSIAGLLSGTAVVGVSQAGQAS